MKNIGLMCDNCNERSAVTKHKCTRCYYASRRNSTIRDHEINKRNFRDNEFGYFTSRQGTVYKVDLDIYNLYKHRLWQQNYYGYAVTNISGRPFLLHRLVLPNIDIVDHIDRDITNNTFANLRDGKGINILNTVKRKPSASGYRGVHKMKDKWQASIMVSGKKYRLGTYEKPELAAIAVKNKASEFGLEEFYSGFQNGI